MYVYIYTYVYSSKKEQKVPFLGSVVLLIHISTPILSAETMGNTKHKFRHN